MFRFILYTFMACVAAFGGVSWAMRGFPNPGKAFETAATGPVGAGPQQMTLAATFGGQSAKDYDRKMWEAEHTMQSDNDSKLDRIRMEALQTANAYAMAPCGEFTKLNLVAALTAYTRAWQDRMDCPRPMNMLMFCGDKKLKETAATFSTPLDIRVQAALATAFQQQGIVKADFPAAVRRDMLQFAGPGLWFNESPTCAPRRRASVSGSR
jgi:hypothetical protein